MKKKITKRIFQVLLLTGTAISLFYVPWPILFARLSPMPKTIQAQVDKASDYGFDGIIVYVDQKGKAPAWYTSGYKNREAKTPTDPHALFKIASVDKLYTALCIAKLVNHQQVSLEKSLADYFPELEGKIEYANEITIRMMVQHRSGILDFTRVNSYWAHPKSTAQECLEIVLNQPANFKPDARFQYSNTNYLLLSMLIEKVTGESKFQYIKEHILTPLNLHNTYGSIDDVNIDDVMSGYYVGYENDLKYDHNGNMLATAEDLGAFIRALNDGSVFTDEKEHEIYTSLYRYSHTGLIPGYQTIARYHPKLDAVVIQFTNTVDFDGYNWSFSEIMYHRIVKILRKNNQ